MAVAENYVAVVDGFAAEGKAAMNLAIMAVFYEYAGVFVVVGVLVGPCAFAALEDYGIVVYVYVAASHHYVATGINVYGIATRGLEPLGGCIDLAVEVSYSLTTVKMVCPEGAVYQSYVLDGYVGGVGDVYEPWAHGLEISALWIVLASYPKLFPVVVAVAVYGAWAADGETTYGVSIYQGSKVVEGLPFHACLHQSEVSYAVATFETGTLTEV